MCGISIMIKNMLKQDNYKGNVFNYDLCKKLVFIIIIYLITIIINHLSTIYFDYLILSQEILQTKYNNEFNSHDIIIICDGNHINSLPFTKYSYWNVEMHLNIYSQETEK